MYAVIFFMISISSISNSKRTDFHQTIFSWALNVDSLVDRFLQQRATYNKWSKSPQKAELSYKVVKRKQVSLTSKSGYKEKKLILREKERKQQI